MQLRHQFLPVLSSLLVQVYCQTTPGTSPSTNDTLNVAYGNTSLNANDLLPQSLVQTQPDVWVNSTLSGNHMILLVDQSIPQSSINSTGLQAAGLEECRTTRLHWFQTDMIQRSNGYFVGAGHPIAAYGGPMPGLDDIAHTYIFYLFKQPANFTLSSDAWNAGRIYNPISTYDRMNFSTEAVAAIPGVGAPLAANYMRVQNPNTTDYATAANGTCPTDSGLASNGTNVTTTSTPTPQATANAAVQEVKRAVEVGMAAVATAALAML